MFIEFRVKNFRSFRDEEVLSLVASKDKTLQDNTFSTDIKAAPVLLRSSVIYGANASGKSNLIKALQYMRSVVVESATIIQPGQIFTVQPFRLDANSSSEPTEFEVTVLLEGVRYQYGFSMTSDRIISEFLLVYKAFKPQKWFERIFDPQTGKDDYSFGVGLKGNKNVWEDATRPNSLFLSMAVQLNSELLRPLFDWFNKGLVIINENARVNSQISIQKLKHDESRKEICNFLSSADISIADIQVESKTLPGKSVLFHFESKQTEFRDQDIEDNRIRFHHITEEGNAVFELADESNGTRNFLFLAGPLLEILSKGLTLVFDELDTSLHTLLVQAIVDLFHKPEINTGGAQLIFTTHDTALLDAPFLFRRDQIWFTEKDRNQVSKLIPLSEFSPRKNEALGRGYLMGRYGGLPMIEENFGIKSK